MEQFIECDAHKKFSVFVAVNEKGQAGEALRVAHDRQLYREYTAYGRVAMGRGRRPKSKLVMISARRFALFLRPPAAAT
jgi:hypothetical protein